MTGLPPRPAPAPTLGRTLERPANGIDSSEGRAFQSAKSAFERYRSSPTYYALPERAPKDTASMHLRLDRHHSLHYFSV